MVMSKILILTVLLNLMFVDLNAQIIPGNFLLDIDGAYNSFKTNSEIGYSRSEVSQKGFSANLSCGYVTRQNVIIGLGLEFNNSKHYGIYANYVPDSFLTETDEKIKLRSVSPYIYLKYYHQIINRIYFLLDFSLYYGHYWEETNAISATIQILNFDEDSSQVIFDDHVYDNIHGIKDKNNDDQIILSLKPEFRFLLSKRVGFYIITGGISYTSLNSKGDSFAIDFSSKNWNYGLFIRLGSLEKIHNDS
jgi:hypothetical protein